MRVHITQDVLRLNVSVANSLSVDVGDRPHKLVRVKLHNKVWHLLLHFMELLHYSIGRVWNVVHHHVQVHLIWLVSIGVEALPHFHAVGVMEHFQDGELSILVSFVLKHFLNSHGLTSFGNSGLKHHTERSISNNFFSVIGHALKGLRFKKWTYLLLLSSTGLVIVVFLYKKQSQNRVWMEID